MRSICTLAVLAGLATVSLAGFLKTGGSKPETSAAPAAAPAAANAAKPKAEPADDRLIVHEWGTFTSVSGSDGVRLEFRPLVDDDLPAFVLNRAWQSGIPDPIPSKLGYRVFQRMETPVTYFYTEREREVQVRVGFPQGLLTEFYPPVAGMKPEFNWKKRAAIGQSELDWGTVTLIPTSHLRTNITTSAIEADVRQRLLDALLPDSHIQHHYVYARETDSAIVHVKRPADPRRPVAPQGDFYEKFLFYRGLGNFPLPLNAVARGNDEFEITNSGPSPIRSLFLVTSHEGQVRFAQQDQVPAGGQVVMKQSANVSSVDALSAAVVKALEAERLYTPEAQAMVKTWRDSWFEEEGTRLFYMLPPAVTEELLPLTIVPAPDEVVRVMVGRLEIMTPESEQRIRKVVQASIVKRADDAKKAAELRTAIERGEAVEQPKTDEGPQLPKALLELGRLAEPALVRVKYFSAEPTVKEEAGRLLNELHQHWTAELEGK